MGTYIKKASLLVLAALCLIAQNQNRAIMLADVDQPATPTDSPGGGTYSSTQSVTLSDATATLILYTIDGSTPACPGTGTLYTTMISVAATTTIKAIGCNGITGGGVLTSVYTINSAVSTPTDSPGAATYAVPESVTLSDATGGATICYTTDGSTPGAATPGICDSSPTRTYSGAFILAPTTTLKAIGTKTGNTNSSVLSSTYTITSPLGPVDSFVNCNTSSPGTTLTTTILNNCTQGNGNLGGWTNSGAYTGFTIAAHQTGCTLGGGVRVNGTSFQTSTTSQAIAFDNSLSVPRYISNTTGAVGFSQAEIAGCFIPGPATTVAASNKIFDAWTIIGPSGTFSVMQLNTGTCGGAGGAGVYGVGLHYQDAGGGSVLTGCITMVPGTAYWCSLHADFANGTPHLSCYDGSTHAQVGSTINAVTTPTKTGTAGAAISFRVGNNEVGTDTATTYFENLVLSFSGQANSPIGPTSTSFSAPFLVSKTFNATALSGSSTTTASSAIELPAGVTNAVFISMENASATVSGCADTAGNTYTQSATVNLAANGHGDIWTAVNTTANASNVVTCTHTASTFRNIFVNAIGGANPTAPVDTGHTATGTTSSGADVTTGSFTPSTATGSVLACGYITAGQALLAGTNYAGINTSATTSASCAFRYAAPSSSQTASLIQSNTSSKWMLAVPYKQ